VSLNRYAKRTDSTQSSIVTALRHCGVTVWIISRPCDLLTYYKGRWKPLEVKASGKKPRKDQAEQAEFIRSYAVPVVSTFEEAFAAINRE
jgi:hypothetical protein